MVLKLDTSESRPETPEEFRNVVLEKDEEVIWTDHVRNEEVLQRVKEETKILQKIKKKEG